MNNQNFVNIDGLKRKYASIRETLKPRMLHEIGDTRPRLLGEQFLADALNTIDFLLDEIEKLEMEDHLVI